jgi:hypothetical protein
MLKQRILQFAQARFHAIGRLHPDGTGGGGRESNSPASVMPAKPVLKTGGVTGPHPPPRLDLSTLFPRNLRGVELFANELLTSECAIRIAFDQASPECANGVAFKRARVLSRRTNLRKMLTARPCDSRSGGDFARRFDGKSRSDHRGRPGIGRGTALRLAKGGRSDNSGL